MRFRLVVDGEPREIEVEGRPRGATVRVDDAAYRARIRRRADGFEVTIGRNSYRVRFDGVHAVLVDGSHEVRVVDVSEESLAHRAAATDRGPVKIDVRAAMPGRVVRIAVAPGDRVKRGQTLVVLEAMKMQNEIPSPRDGVVQALGVVEGESVSADRVVAVVAGRGPAAS